MDSTQDTESPHPRSWRWDDDGRTISGTYERVDSAESEYGRRAIVVINVNGESRSLWLNETALASKFRDELASRAARDFTAGERITVTKGAKKVEGGNGRAYWPFSVVFADAPKRSAAELLGVDAPQDTAASTAGEGDDEVPF